MTNYQIDRNKCAKLSISEQVGTIGSEVGRALAAKQRGDDERAKAAFYRGLDLLDATAAIWAAGKSPRTREILRSREQFVAAMESGADNKLEEYFMQYAIVARRQSI